MLLCVKPMGLSVTICMGFLMILMISHPMILFFSCIQYFVGLCVTEVTTLCEWLRLYDFATSYKYQFYLMVASSNTELFTVHYTAK